MMAHSCENDLLLILLRIMAEFTDTTEGAEDRLQYLKDHGVEVETVEDRALAEKKMATTISPLLAQIQISSSGPASSSDVKFVLIPQDTAKPFRQLSLTSKDPLTLTRDAIPDYVKPYFADSIGVDAGLLQQQATKQFASGDMKDLADTNISAAAMNRVAQQGSVETFSLVHPADTNKYTGVYIYLDEVGLLKKLQVSPRC